MSVFTSSGKRLMFVAITLFIPTLFISTAFISLKSDEGLKIGKTMPLGDRPMKGVDGHNYSLESLMKENGLIVIFSCNTCPFVVGGENFGGWEKQYNTLYDEATANSIGFVLVNSNEAKRDGVDSFDEMTLHANASEYKMPYIVDAKSELADALGAKTTPHVFVFNNAKKLIYKGSIDNSWDSKRTVDQAYLNDVIKSLKKGEKVKENSTPPRGCSIKRVKILNEEK